MGENAKKKKKKKKKNESSRRAPVVYIYLRTIQLITEPVTGKNKCSL